MSAFKKKLFEFEFVFLWTKQLNNLLLAGI